VFPPPEVILPIGGRRAESAGAPAAARSGLPGALPGPDQGVATPAPGTEGGAAAGDAVPDGAGSGAEPARQVQPAAVPAAGEPQGTTEPAKKDESEEPRKPARERDPNWDRLRSPGTEPRP
jgi:hypothetical protein